MSRGHHIDERITCTICEKEARSRGGLKLHFKECSKDQDKTDNNNNESFTGRGKQNWIKIVKGPLTFDLQIDDTFFPYSIRKQFIQEMKKFLTA